MDNYAQRVEEIPACKSKFIYTCRVIFCTVEKGYNGITK